MKHEIHKTPEERQADGIAGSNQLLNEISLKTDVTNAVVSRVNSGIQNVGNAIGGVLSELSKKTDQTNELLQARPEIQKVQIDGLGELMSQLKGPKGDKGEQGDTGGQGVKGDKGDRGDKGDKGDRGSDGKDGENGKKGDKGDKGDTGQKGDTGGVGARGSDGKDGKDADPEKVIDILNEKTRALDFKVLKNVPDFQKAGLHQSGVGGGALGPAGGVTSGTLATYDGPTGNKLGKTDIVADPDGLSGEFSIWLKSTDEGGVGEDTVTNSTRRLLLESYQKAQDTENYGEVIRIYERHDRSKQMIAWYSRFKSGTVTFSTDTFTCVDHYLKVGERVVLSTTGTLPSNFSTGSYVMDTNGDYTVTGSYYFVVAVTSTTFKLSATKAGTAISGSGGSGTHSFEQLPQLEAWIGQHYNPNDTFDGTSPHDHISIETNDADGLIRTRFEILTEWLDQTQVNVTNADFTVRSGTSNVAGADGATKEFGIYTSSGIIDAKQITQNTSLAFGEANATTKYYRIGQTITAGTTRYVGVRFYKSADTGTFTGTVTVSLYATSGFLPTGSPLGTVTISNASWLALSTGENTATFSSQINGLTVGSVYILVFEASTADTTNHPNIGANSAGGYSGGVAKYYNATDDWTNLSSDLYFKMLMPNSGVTRDKSKRWAFYGDTSVEQNTADGTDLKLARLNNSGTFIDNCMIVNRSTGYFGFGANVDPLYRHHFETTTDAVTQYIKNTTGGGNNAANVLSESATATSRLYQGRVTGDTTARYSVEASGKQEWGPGGSTARDTNLYRNAADQLKTDDTFMSKGGSYYLLKNSGLSVASTTSANTLITSYSLAANTVEAAGSSITGDVALDINFWFDINNTANSKVINIHMGTAGTTSDANIGTLTTTTTGTVGGRVNVKVWRQSATTIRAICTTYRGSTVSINAMTTTSTNVDFASNMTISVFGSSVANGDYTARALEIELQR